MNHILSSYRARHARALQILSCAINECERLEPRRLLAAFATFNPASGKVSVTGTGGDDTITIGLSPKENLRVTLNGQHIDLLSHPVTRIAVDGGDGNDSITITVGIRMNVSGGPG